MEDHDIVFRAQQQAVPRGFVVFVELHRADARCTDRTALINILQGSGAPRFQYCFDGRTCGIDQQRFFGRPGAALNQAALNADQAHVVGGRKDVPVIEFFRRNGPGGLADGFAASSERDVLEQSRDLPRGLDTRNLHFLP